MAGSVNIAVCASGNGSNFSAIVEAVQSGKLQGCRVALMVCDNPKALVVERARNAGVPVALVPREAHKDKRAFEAAIIEHLESEKIELIVLAGFMRLLSPAFVRAWKGKILNVHPSLLPAFKGTEGIKDAFDYGVKITGVSVHFVDEELDHGPIIAQGAVLVEESDTVESLEKKVHALEHELYSRAIQLVVSARLSLRGRKVKVS